MRALSTPREENAWEPYQHARVSIGSIQAPPSQLTVAPVLGDGKSIESEA